jgi:histidine decarboxylase
MRYIESDQDLTLRGDRLLEAIAKDKEKGLIPFFVSTVVSCVAGNPAFSSEKEIVFLKIGYLIYLHLVLKSRMVELNFHSPISLHVVMLN